MMKNTKTAEIKKQEYHKKTVEGVLKDLNIYLQDYLHALKSVSSGK
jgi:hypothetical protein